MEFRNLNNLQRVIYTHQVSPHEADALSVMPPSTVFFADNQLNKPSQVHRLDCSGSTPTVCQSYGPYNQYITSLSCLKHLNENLLIIAAPQGLQAFKLDTSEVTWRKDVIHEVRQREIYDSYMIVADTKGRLFVNDVSNKCIQMFSVSDGQYLGCLIKEGEYGLGELGKMCFSESNSKLAVISIRKDGTRVLAILRVE